MLRRLLGISLAVAVLVGGGLAARELTRPAVVTTDEQRITLDPGETRTVHAQTSGGLPFSSALSWSVSPPWLGTISPRGEFRAGAVTGKGTLTARFGASSKAIEVTISCPKQAQLSAVRLDVSCGRLADVYVDVSAYGGATAAAAAVDREAARVASNLAIPAERRFRVYYFGTTPAYASGITELSREFASGPSALEGDAVYFDFADVIAIDQSSDPLMETSSQLRHELVHRFLRQYVGYANINEIPAWLNEGLAYLEESTYVSRLRTEARLVAASMAHAGRLPSLRTLTSQDDWNARTGIDGFYQYHVAAQAAQFLMNDAQLAGLGRLLRRVRDGASFSDAFAYAIPGEGYKSFQDDFSDRVAGLVKTYPGIIAEPGTPYGRGATVIGYGLGPDRSAKVKAVGPVERESSVEIDEYGVFVKYLGSEFPAGEYVVTVDVDGKPLSVKFRL